MAAKSLLSEIEGYSPYQFAFFRILLGVYLFGHFFAPDPFHLTLAALALPLFLGWRRRPAAFLLWCGWAYLTYLRQPISGVVGWLLLAAAFVPTGDPLALAEEKADWKFPPVVFYLGWIVLGVGYGAIGLAKLGKPSRLPPFEIMVAPLILVRRTRPLAWAFFLLITLIGSRIDMLLLQLLALDPRWLPPSPARKRAVVFFDGVCGLCNRFVNFLFKEDRKGIFFVSPLQGEPAAREIPSLIKGNGDYSTIVLVDDDRVLTRSSAVLRVFHRLGGIWRVLSWLRVVPAPFRDGVYGWVAKNRYRWFGRKETCRLPTPEERERFIP